MKKFPSTFFVLFDIVAFDFSLIIAVIFLKVEKCQQQFQIPTGFTFFQWRHLPGQ